jgi:hypothetical protein
MPRKMPRSAPPTTFRAARAVSSRLRPALALQEGRKSPSIDAGSSVIRGIPAKPRSASKNPSVAPWPPQHKCSVVWIDRRRTCRVQCSQCTSSQEKARHSRLDG